MRTIPAIPHDLKAFKQFLTWRLEHRPGDAKPTKVPQASVTDPSTWMTYEDAVNAFQADSSLTGVGFVFTDDDPFVFLDVDGCLTADGSWSHDALHYINSIHGASWETSQSGTGLHAIARADKAVLKRKRNVFKSPSGGKCEFYITKRFMAIGQGNWTVDVPFDATKYFLELIPDRPETVDTTDDLIDGPRPGYTGPRSDADLIKRACEAGGSAATAFGSKATFNDLWTANASRLVEHFPDETGQDFDHSLADAALMERLAFWTGYDETRMIRLFGQSALAQRDKWQKRPDYQARTVKSVTTRSSARYIGSDRTDRGAVSKTVAQSGAVDVDWTPPAVEPDKNDHNYMMRVMYELGARLTYDAFACRILLNGEPIDDSDYLKLYFDACTAAAQNFPKQKAYDAIDYMAFRRSFHPVKDYLESVATQWDGAPRLDTWLTDFASAPDTPYTRAAASKIMIGAVRRIYEPGCKHDEMIVLEGAQNTGKSTLVRSLCADASWFTDGVTLNMESKELIEVTKGRWFVEAPELSRLTGAEAEHVKAMLSRTEDVARLAYGRDTATRKRQFVIFGTTNEEQYLQDLTGNRRFLPVSTGAINIEGIVGMRDQLFAEAVTRYRAGESNFLPKEVQDEARAVQAERVFDNEYADQLADLLGDKTGTISTRTLLTVLEVPAPRRRYANKPVTAAMKLLGWEKSGRSFIKGNPARKWNALGTVLAEAAPELKTVHTMPT